MDKYMTTSLELKVRTEIVALHEFFVSWFSGNLAVNTFEDGFLSRFDQKFQLIPPAGNLMSLQALHGAVQRSYGTNPEFRIVIRNVKILKVFDGHVLATYEEWQRNALASKPADNARIASVIFKHCEPLQWLHVHETWLPDSIASAGPYDF